MWLPFSFFPLSYNPSLSFVLLKSFDCVSLLLFLLWNILLSAIACPIQCLPLQTDQIHDPAVFHSIYPGGGRPILSSAVIIFSSLHSIQLSGEHVGQLKTRSCLQLPLSLSTSLQSLCYLSLSAWPFDSSVDLVMILVTDQSLLAEIWGHSGSWECCCEEFDVCTAICNGSSPLGC